jgi:NADH-ubiquinone oxidoreductase chain 5
MGWPNYQTFKVFESGNIILFVLISLSILSIFIGYLAKELFVGVGTDTWQSSINTLSQNNFLETELSFIFGGNFALNKLFPLMITLFAIAVAALILITWNRIISNSVFRIFYTFINQKWYFDLIYFNFIISPLLSVGYNITFKLIDRGILEAVGSTAISNRFSTLFNALRVTAESGSLYGYISLQLPIVLLLVFSIFI